MKWGLLLRREEGLVCDYTEQRSNFPGNSNIFTEDIFFCKVAYRS
jgi:hypothetical protein